MATLNDYLSLVTSEHADKPNFIAFLSALLQPTVDNINVVATLPTLFDVDTAVGQQLDFVAQWIGFSRALAEPIAGVYFSLDTVGVGLDEGVWFDPFDPTEGVVLLDDGTFRIMLYAKIAANMWSGSLEDAEKILAEVFVGFPNTHVFIEDNFDMSITIGVTGVLPSALFQALLEQGYFTVKPEGVRIAAVNIGPGPFFGLDNENYNISGLDVGTFT